MGTRADSFPPQTTSPRAAAESIAPPWPCTFVRPEPAVFHSVLECADQRAVMR